MTERVSGKVKGLSFLLLALTVPLTIRFVPEAIAWPYPTGFDSLIYANAMIDGYPFNGPWLVKSACFLYLIAWALNSLTGDLLLTMKLLGALAFCSLCGSLYVYARSVLRWGHAKSLMVSVLAGSYFILLGMSWQMYRMTLGLAFLVASLIAARLEDSKLRVVALTAFCLLTTWTHEIAAITLFALMAVLFALGRADKKSLAISVTPSILLFAYQRYDEAAGTLSIPTCAFQASSSSQATLYVFGYFVYAFLPLSPLIVLGLRRLRHVDVVAFSALCLALALMPVYSPYLPLFSSYAGYWYRGALMLALPLMFFAVEGLERFWSAKGRWARACKSLAVMILALNFAMTAFYVACPPESQIAYFGEWNNYKQFVPTSMLQNSVSIRDTPHVIEALEWVKSNLNPKKTALVLHEAIDNWAGVVVGKAFERVRVNEDSISSPERRSSATSLLEVAEAKASECREVYTVWWIDDKGWYTMPSLPRQFAEVRRFGDMAVYRYAPQA